MSDSKHTPGPWTWVGENYIDGPNGESVLECGDDGKDWGLHSAVLRVSEADKRLIAAAPKLKEALEYVKGYLQERTDWRATEPLIGDIERALESL